MAQRREPAFADDPAGGDTSSLTRELRLAASGEFARQLSRRFLEEHCILPLEVSNGGLLRVAAGRPLDPEIIDELGYFFDRPIEIVEAPEAEIQAAVMAASGREDAFEDTGLRSADLELVAEAEEAFDDVRALADRAPVIKLVNVLILEALQARASDLHLESTDAGLRVRHRIDGVLHDVSTAPIEYQTAVISRIKIMASVNIAERRLPQDGRIRLRLSEREVDLRVSTLPSIHGESVVLRILDRGGRVRDARELGMSDEVQGRFLELTSQPHGIVLVTGPTGSGKTTTLYAALSELNRPERKIITVEDPVEYQLEGITQIALNRKAGLSFASALRSILRHDPDILMVGEMRDAETAAIAVQSALTGHLVFSTLHTNDAPGALTRLLDMGIEPFLVSATVRGILAQRLIRVVCESCAERSDPDEAELLKLGLDPEELFGGGAEFRHGRGCDSCSGTGYRGRTGIYEILPMTKKLSEIVARGGTSKAMGKAATKAGLQPLRADGLAKARAGVTTIQEVLRVTRGEERP
ncbi:MAG: GspE/PulE family protein [Gemmatimonadota bacterium]|jgi:general secretion pathway protein E